MIEQGQGREPGDDYPGGPYDAELEGAIREAIHRQWWNHQTVPFCHAAALAADALRDFTFPAFYRTRDHALPRCSGCGGPIPGFTVGGRYCSITCYRNFEGEV